MRKSKSQAYGNGQAQASIHPVDVTVSFRSLEAVEMKMAYPRKKGEALNRLPLVEFKIRGCTTGGVLVHVCRGAEGRSDLIARPWS